MSENKKSNSPDPQLPNQEYRVDKIVDSRINSNGAKEYLIKWFEFDDIENTWEPEGNLDCPSLLKEFESKKLAREDNKKQNTDTPTPDMKGPEHAKKGSSDSLATADQTNYTLPPPEKSGLPQTKSSEATAELTSFKIPRPKKSRRPQTYCSGATADWTNYTLYLEILRKPHTESSRATAHQTNYTPSPPKRARPLPITSSGVWAKYTPRPEVSQQPQAGSSGETSNLQRDDAIIVRDTELKRETKTQVKETMETCLHKEQLILQFMKEKHEQDMKIMMRKAELEMQLCREEHKLKMEILEIQKANVNENRMNIPLLPLLTKLL